MSDTITDLEFSLKTLKEFDCTALDKSAAFGVDGYEFEETRRAM